jgi:hypothetical protein
MPARLRSLAVAMLIAAALPAGVHAQKEKGATTYRWVDEKGVVHYGDRVPPQYAQKESTILNSQGVQVGKLEAQKTPEQLAEEARRQQEVLRQKQHDNFLMLTYASVADIERLREERLATLRAQRGAAEQYIENLHSRMSLLQARALLFKPYNPRKEARRMPDDLAEDMVRTLKEMRTQNSLLVSKDEEEAVMRGQFQADIERFKVLRSARNSR